MLTAHRPRIGGIEFGIIYSGLGWKSVLAKAFFWILLLIVGVIAVFAAVVSFDKFLQVAVPVLVFITGISWAVRIRNVHWYVAEEINMETHIYLYDAAGSGETKKNYKRIIENCNERVTTSLLKDAQLSSYTTFYLFISVLFLFAAEMFVLIYNSPQDCCTSQCLCVCWTAVGSFVGSLFFFVCACVSLYTHFFSSSKEKSRFTQGFRKSSACFASKTYVFNEDWIRFYRKEPEEQIKDLNKLEPCQRELQKKFKMDYVK